MPATITTQQLAYFLSAVRLGSLSAAAEANYIAQPSLSEQIRRLERQLGVTLFVRTNRRLILTDAARLLVPHAERAVTALEEAVASVAPVRELTGGTVAFGTFSSAHLLILDTDLVARFHERYPQVRIRLVGHNSVQVADAVREGDLDAGLVGVPIDDRELEVRPVSWQAEAVYFSREPDRTRQPVDIEELARRTLIMPEAREGDLDPTRRRLLERAQAAGVELRPQVEVDSPAVALALAARGVGDTVISLPVAHALRATDDLHWAPLDPPVHERFAFVVRKDAGLSPATEVLLELAEELLADLAVPT